MGISLALPNLSFRGALLLLLVLLGCRSESQAGLKQGTVTIVTQVGQRVQLKIEIAQTPEQRARGLMDRESLPENAGMLFAYPKPTLVSFWMKDTTIPLSIAFISSEGRILEIQDMQPLSQETHTPQAPFLYALEVRQGLFQRYGVQPGDRIEGDLPRPKGSGKEGVQP